MRGTVLQRTHPSILEGRSLETTRCPLDPAKDRTPRLGCSQHAGRTFGIPRNPLDVDFPSGVSGQSLLRPIVMNPVWPIMRCSGRTDRPVTAQLRIKISKVSISMKALDLSIESLSCCT